MRCKECGNDLMLSIEPEGWRRIFRLLPLATYRCLRCGHTTLRFSASGTHFFVMKIVLAALVLAGMGAAIWRSDLGSKSIPPKTVAEHAPVERRQVDPPPAAKPQVVESDLTARATPQPEEKPAPQEAVQAEPRPAPPKVAPDTPPSAAKAPEPAKASQSARQAAEAKPAQAAKAAAASPETQPHTLGSVETLRENGEVMVSLLVDGPIKHFSKFPLQSPPRLVVDLPGRWTYAGAGTFAINAGGVQILRLGLHEDKLRLVFDLDADAKKPVEPAILTVPHGLLITLH